MALAGGNANLSINDLSMGVSAQGVAEYLENLKINCFEKAIEHLNDTADIQSALDAGWQGKAKEVFVRQFNESVKELQIALSHEYGSLETEINNIMNDYYAIDNGLMGE